MPRNGQRDCEVELAVDDRDLSLGTCPLGPGAADQREQTAEIGRQFAAIGGTYLRELRAAPDAALVAELGGEAIDHAAVHVERDVREVAAAAGVAGVDLLRVDEHEVAGAKCVELAGDLALLVTCELGADQVLVVEMRR
nr:hypothetical protein [Nannocystis sp.]